MRLIVPFAQTLRMFENVEHETFRKAIVGNWRLDENGEIRPQSILWLFCWAATGMNSETAMSATRDLFNRIFDHTYEWCAARVPHEYARLNRYTSRDICAELAQMLAA